MADCDARWTPAEFADAPCESTDAATGAGVRRRTYSVLTAPLGGGAACAHADGFVAEQACTVAVHCAAEWAAWIPTECSGAVASRSRCCG